MPAAGLEVAAIPYVRGDGAWCGVGTKSHLGDHSGLMSSAGRLLGSTAGARRAGRPDHSPQPPAPEVTALRGLPPGALCPPICAPRPQLARAEAAALHAPRKGPQDAPTDISLVREGREGGRPRAPGGWGASASPGGRRPSVRPRLHPGPSDPRAEALTPGRGDGRQPAGLELGCCGDCRRAASREGSSALPFVAGGAGAGPSLRLWAAFISGPFLSWESTWAQPQTVSEAADHDTGGVVSGRGSQGMPPCLRGSDNPVDAKSPSGQDRARLSEEWGRAELNQCDLHRPPTSSPAGQLGSLQGARLPGAVTVSGAGPPRRPLQPAVSSATCGAQAAELPPGDGKPVTAPAHRGYLPAPIAAPAAALPSAPLSLVYHAQT